MHGRAAKATTFWPQQGNSVARSSSLELTATKRNNTALGLDLSYRRGRGDGQAVAGIEQACLAEDVKY